MDGYLEGLGLHLIHNSLDPNHESSWLPWWSQFSCHSRTPPWKRHVAIHCGNTIGNGTYTYPYIYNYTCMFLDPPLVQMNSTESKMNPWHQQTIWRCCWPKNILLVEPSARHEVIGDNHWSSRFHGWKQIKAPITISDFQRSWYSNWNYVYIYTYIVIQYTYIYIYIVLYIYNMYVKGRFLFTYTIHSSIFNIFCNHQHSSVDMWSASLRRTRSYSAYKIPIVYWKSDLLHPGLLQQHSIPSWNTR